MSHWDDKDFIEELERRTKSFLDGTAKTYTWEEVKESARKALAEKKAKKKTTKYSNYVNN